MRVTEKFLKKRGACLSQRLLFRRTFGVGGRVTLARLRRADKVGLDLRWFSCVLLPGESYTDFIKTSVGRPLYLQYLYTYKGSGSEEKSWYLLKEAWFVYLLEHLEARFGRD